MTLLLIVGMAIATYLTRAPLMLLMRGDLAPWLRRWLQFVPVAVFAALVVPPLAAPRGYPEPNVGLLIGLVAGLAAWYTRQVFAAIAAGLLIFALSRLFG